MGFNQSLLRHGLIGLLTLGASLLAFNKQAEAQSIPACRDIQPRPLQVCYTEHPFSARQRDEGGTKQWSFIVERVAPNYVIVDYQLIVDRRFGSASMPTGSIVSASGNASIIQTTTREMERLGETRSQLRGRVQGCYPPVCGQIQGQIDRIDREIERLSDTRTTAVSAGGNEKIQFTHTTSVSCRSYLGVTTCGEGAAVDGRVRVNQRYLGDPNALSQASMSLVEESNSLLRQASNPSQLSPTPSYDLLNARAAGCYNIRSLNNNFRDANFRWLDAKSDGTRVGLVGGQSHGTVWLLEETNQGSLLRSTNQNHRSRGNYRWLDGMSNGTGTQLVSDTSHGAFWQLEQVQGGYHIRSLNNNFRNNNSRWLDGASNGNVAQLVNGTSHGTIWELSSTSCP